MRLKRVPRFFFLLLLALPVPPCLAEVSYIDLSKAANLGPAQSLEGAAPGGEDLKEKEGFANIPQGPQTLRGIPFLLLDSIKNQSHSFVVLKGKRKTDFPEALDLPTGHLKAADLYFLHSCRWGGTASNITVAEYDVIYEDGQVAVIPLRVGLELTNFTGADDTPASYLAWWHKYKNTDMGLSLFPWKNPRPEAPIQSILFKSLNKMPVPILFAITASDTDLPISSKSPKPEKTFQTDTTGWVPFEPSEASPAGTAIDMSFLLDAPAGKHGKVKANGDGLVFEDGTPAKFWGTQLTGEWWNLTNEDLAQMAVRLAVYGCNLVSVADVGNSAVTDRLQDLEDALKSKGIYLDIVDVEKTQTPVRLTGDPAVLPPGLWPIAQAEWGGPVQGDSNSLQFKDDPMVLHPDTSLPCLLTLGRFLEKPFQVSWNVHWPNEYLEESPLLMSTYGVFSNWSVCVGMGMGSRDWGPSLSADIDLLNKPLLLAQWPAASLAYLRGDLHRGRVNVLAVDNLKAGQGTKALLGLLAHYSGKIESGGLKTDPAGALKAKVQERLKSIVSDTGQINWQGNVGVVQVSSPRFQALIGFIGHRKLASPVWQVESPIYFGAISLISLTKTNLWASEHMLLTGVTRMENTGQIYNAAKTKLISQGKAPILVEPLQAKFTLFRYKADPKLKVRALDANGLVIQKRVPIKWAKNNLVFSWVPKAFYFEIYK